MKRGGEGGRGEGEEEGGLEIASIFWCVGVCVVVG